MLRGEVRVARCEVDGCDLTKYGVAETELSLCFPHLEEWHNTPTWISDEMFLRGASHARVVIWPWV